MVITSGMGGLNPNSPYKGNMIMPLSYKAIGESIRK